jgi:hypothetical protein
MGGPSIDPKTHTTSEWIDQEIGPQPRTRLATRAERKPVAPGRCQRADGRGGTSVTAHDPLVCAT